MRIGCGVLTTGSNEARLSATITCADGQRELWYSLPSSHVNWFSLDRCDGFVVGLLFQAMERNENIVVEEPLSSRLFHSLQSFYIPMMAGAFPNLHPIKIVPTFLTSDCPGGKGVATGFSAGIDSFATVIEHLVHETLPDRRLSHFLFHNAGSHGHGKPDDARKLFRQRYDRIQAFSQEVGLPVIPVDSNLAEIFPIDFIRMHSALNASIPLVLQNQFQSFYYASTYKYADCGVNRIDDVARFDPFAFHLFSTEGLDCVSTGCQMSRVQKTELVATYEPSHRYLNVCVDPAFDGRNCSVCFKCCRTLVTLELLGVADAYQAVFDVKKFRKIRNRYLLKCLRYRRGSFEAEIAGLFRTEGSGPFVGAFGLRHL